MKRIVLLALVCWFTASGVSSQERPSGPAGGRQMVPRPPVQRHAPFRITREEYQDMVAVLSAWERASTKVDLMRCTLVVLEYDSTFNYRRDLRGYLQYKAPDKGLYDVSLSRVIDLSNGEAMDVNRVPAAQRRQHWVCDGRSVFEFRHAEKKVIRRDLPPQLQGAGIGDGPLPFFFGAKANKLLKRYFMRLNTPSNVQGSQVWVEAYPRFQHDAANFRRATVILDRQTMQPLAVEVYEPGDEHKKDRKVYKFSNIRIGRNLLEKLFNANDFNASVPAGYELIKNPGAPQAAANGRIGPPGPPRKITPRGQRR